MQDEGNIMLLEQCKKKKKAQVSASIVRTHSNIVATVYMIRM